VAVLEISRWVYFQNPRRAKAADQGLLLRGADITNRRLDLNQSRARQLKLCMFYSVDRAGRVAMKHISMIAFSVVAGMLPAFAQDTVPYAYRPPTAGDTYVPSLGDIMGATQLRHFKLSYAGLLGNWELASYELDQIEDSLVNAARLYQNIPIEKINMVEQPLMALANSIKVKDGARFASAFADLTAACNSCHEAAHVGFIRIQVPTSSPFSNQSFMPKAK
jgi:hypothetical protein